MRLVAVLIPLLFLTVLSWISFGSWGASDPGVGLPQWRRTTSGWERKETWSYPTAVAEKPLHPLVVGGFQFAAVLAGLVASSKERDIR